LAHTSPKEFSNKLGGVFGGDEFCYTYRNGD